MFSDQGFKGAFRSSSQLFAVSVLLFSFLGNASAQELSRKVIAKTAASYPELAKKMHVAGKVRIEVVIAASGAVNAARLVGGNPVFEKSAVEAVKQWRFETGPKETKAVVVLEFVEE